MSIDNSVDEHLYRIFTENFTARDIATALVSFDETAPAADVKQFMLERHFRIVGIRRHGLVVGFVKQDELDGDTCSDRICEIGQEDVIDAWSPFTSIIAALRDRDRVFVRSFGQIGGLVSRSDLQKPPVRMWLFGMVTIIEMKLNRMIERRFPNDSWCNTISAGRLEKARLLLDERRRRNQDLGLLDCLQFSDKGQLVAKDKQLRDRVGFASRRAAEETIKELETLRNGLAHSQAIASSDWETIFRLAKNLRDILAIA